MVKMLEKMINENNVYKENMGKENTVKKLKKAGIFNSRR